VGAHEVAKTLGAPSLSQLTRQLADAQARAGLFGAGAANQCPL
jgi:hypothetical protein